MVDVFGRPKLRVGKKVWLKADASEGWAREQATVVEVNKTCVVVQVKPHDDSDDGLREVDHDQVDMGRRKRNG